MQRKKRVRVLVPVYKDSLDVYEEISLSQAKRVFQRRDICFFSPKSLVFDFGSEYREIAVERFEDFYFKSTQTYSRLLLSEEFYNRFKGYEYILIYQLDAFAFEDRLDYFCDMGYDFYGAPMRAHDIMPISYIENGGFSLRKTETSMRVCEKREQIIDGLECKDYINKQEDNFFSYCALNKSIEYSMPDAVMASRFSTQTDAGHGFREMYKRGLPFGCHHWPTMNYWFWKQVIGCYGYCMPPLDLCLHEDTLMIECKKREKKYIRYYIRHADNNMLRELIKLLGLDPYDKVHIWGGGVCGRECLRIMRCMKVDVACFYDSFAKEKSTIEGVDVFTPDFDEMRKENGIIIIASYRYEGEIEKELMNNGFIKGVDYCIYSELLSALSTNIKRTFGSISGINEKFDMRMNTLLEEASMLALQQS